MSGWAYGVAWLVVGIQVLFGALEIFAPRWVFDRVFPRYYDTRTAPTWVETEQLTRNMGLYNWFLALGLSLTLMGHLGFLRLGQFFVLCVALAGAFGLISVGPKVAFGLQLGLGLLAFVLPL